MAEKKENKLPSSHQLISGDYEHPLSENENQWGARKIFLDLLPQIAPKTIDRLRDGVYEPFCQFKRRMAEEGVFGVFYSNLDRATGMLDFTLFLYGDWETMEKPASYSEIQRSLATHYADRKLSAALLAWAVEFHIVADWVLDAALFAMSHWSRDMESEGFYPIRRPIFHERELAVKIYKDMQRPFNFEHPVWNPFLETETAFKERVDTVMRDYVIRMKGIAAGYGTPAAEEQRGRPDRSSSAHFEWFIKNHVLGLSYRVIAKDLPPPGGKRSPESRVGYGVKKVAKLLDLQD